LADFEERNPKSTLADWLQMITLIRTEEDEDGIEGVAMMTLHTAKGLEFRRVFIVGVEEGLLPHKNSSEESYLLEEERRLFYVAITRARDELYLTYPHMRLNAGYGDIFQRPSRFLKEIPNKLIEEWNVSRG
jgi:DNA helicase-2/ATP-dependent DNA helicase PcrA